MTTGDRSGRSSDTGTRVFLALLSLYPAAFRRRFGSEMLELFMVRRDSARSPAARIALWAAVVSDTACSIVRERIPARSNIDAAAQRTREIGIRMALGATRSDIGRLVTRSGLALCVIGAALGAGGGYAMGRSASTMLYGIQPADPSTYAALVAAVLAIAAAASWIPARRAMRVDPAAVLRRE
jgi:hypothetical protein